MWNLGLLGSAAAGPAEIEEIISYSSSSVSASSVVFNNLLQYSNKYKHLQLWAYVRSNRSGAHTEPLKLNFNDDATSVYSYRHMDGNGSSYYISQTANQGKLYVGEAVAATSAGYTIYGANIINIYDPWDTNKNTSTLCLNGGDFDGYQLAVLSSGSWNKTDPINKITLDTDFGNAMGGMFTLVGVK